MTCESPAKQTLRSVLVISIPVVAVQVCLTIFSIRNDSAVAQDAWRALIAVGIVWLIFLVVDGYLRELVCNENLRRREIPLQMRTVDVDGPKRRVLRTVARAMRWPFDP